MEIAVSCGIGGAVAVCIACAIPDCGSGDATDDSASHRRPDEVVWAGMQTIGAWLEAAGIVRADAARALEREMRLLDTEGRWCGAAFDRHMAVGSTVAACVLASVVSGMLSGSIVGVAIGAVAPAASLAVLHMRRKVGEERRLEEIMPEAFGALSISLGSGYSLAQAMRYVSGHVAEPLRSEFMRVSFAVDCGVPMVEALDGMLGRLRAPGLELVVLALKVSQRTGAPLKELFAQATQLVSDRIELRRRLDVKTSQARMSARMVACMPMAMVLLLSLLSSDFRTGVTRPAGAAAVVVALVLNVIAWSVIRKIMDVEL